MIRFKIQFKSDIPVSKQLFDQLRFAIASRQYAPGNQLPSIRQLAMMTGLHRNTISKVYRQLEEIGLVNSLPGSGIYVKVPEEDNKKLLEESPSAQKIIRNTIDELINQGCTLEQVKELFQAEIDWRLKSGSLMLVTVPNADMGVGKLMVSELEEALSMSIQLVPTEELSYVLDQANSATVITSRYFLQEVLTITNPKSIRVIPVDIYDYQKELQLIKNLPKNSCIGIVSLSIGILRVAEILIKSLYANDLSIITAQTHHQKRLKQLLLSASTIITDPASYSNVKKTLQLVKEDLIRFPKIICSDHYISEDSLKLLKRQFIAMSNEQ